MKSTLLKFLKLIDKTLSLITIYSLIFQVVLPLSIYQTAYGAATATTSKSPITATTSKSPITDAIMTGITHQISGTLASLLGTSKQNQLPITNMQIYTPQVVPSKIFAGCLMAKSIPNLPASCGIPDPRYRSQIGMFQSLADQNVLYYDKLLLKSDNNPNTRIGFACIDRELLNAKKTLNGQVNLISQQIDLINKNNQKSKQILQADLDKMALIDSELNGTKTSNVDQQNNPLKKYFNPQCQDLLTANSSGGQLGLNGYGQDLKPLFIKARQVGASANQLTAGVNQSIAKMRAEILRDGLSWNPKNSSAFLNSKLSPSLKKAALLKYKQTQQRFSQISGLLKTSLGSDPFQGTPPMGNFDSRVQNILRNPTAYFSNKYVEACLNSNYDTFSQITNASNLVSQVNTGNRSMKVNNYIKSVNIILSNSQNKSMQAVVQEIQNLDNTLARGLVLSYTSSKGTQQNISPGAYLNKSYSICMNKFNNNEVIKGTSIRGSRDVVAAKKLLTEVQSMQTNNASSISNYITSQVLNCNGQALVPGECSDKLMNSSSESFCISKATQCSAQVNNCNSQINTAIASRKNLLKITADSFNLKVQSNIAQSEGYLTNIKLQFKNFMNVIDTQFHLAGSPFPTDLFVKMPAATDKYGVKVRVSNGSDALSFLNDLPNKLMKLQEILKKKINEIDKSVQDYKASEAGVIRDNKAKWNAFKKNCSDNMTAINDIIKKSQDAISKDIANCLNVQKAINGPCVDGNPISSLAFDTQKLTSRIQNNKDIMKLVQDKAASCSNSNNASDSELAQILIDSCNSNEAFSMDGFKTMIQDMLRNTKFELKDNTISAKDASKTAETTKKAKKLTKFFKTLQTKGVGSTDNKFCSDSTATDGPYFSAFKTFHSSLYHTNTSYGEQNKAPVNLNCTGISGESTVKTMQQQSQNDIQNLMKAFGL